MSAPLGKGVVGCILVVAVAPTLIACGSRTTALRLSGSNSWVGRATFTLRCNPPGGDIAAPAHARAALAQHSNVLFHPLHCKGGRNPGGT